MTQRQIRMVQAIADGLEQARRDLDGLGAAQAMDKAMSDICRDDPASLGLAATAYYAAMYLAWKDAGCPGLEPDSVQ